MTTQGPEEAPYVPALGFRWLTRFYDLAVSATLKEERFKALLVEQASVRPGQRALDLGCGTATLTIMLKRSCPEAEVIGLDGDPEILAIARAKIAASGLSIELHQGMAYAPPFSPSFFDRVVSSLVFHHLAADDKRRTLAAMRRLLHPGGELHLADWGEAQNPLMRLAYLGVQLIDGFTSTSDNVRGLLIPMMKEAGFASVVETHHEMTLFGTLSLYRAVAP